MAYNESLADRIRTLTKGKRGISEKKMFGGLCILANGNMACGIVDDELMVRVGPDAYEDALAKRYVRPMDFTGKPMRGMIYVGTEGIRTKKSLSTWLDAGINYARKQPPKASKKRQTGK